MNKYFLSLVVIIIFLMCLLTGSAAVFADSRGYDEAEAIRRAQQRLDEIDRIEKEKAAMRYDAGHRSSLGSKSDTFVLWLLVIIGSVWGVYYVGEAFSKQKQEEENKLIQKREQEAELERKLSEAEGQGFKIDDSSKICPACAETIKLKAEICKHCKKTFSKDEIHKAIHLSLNSFFQNK